MFDHYLHYEATIFCAWLNMFLQHVYSSGKYCCFIVRDVIGPDFGQGVQLRLGRTLSIGRGFLERLECVAGVSEADLRFWGTEGLGLRSSWEGSVGGTQGVSHDDDVGGAEVDVDVEGWGSSRTLGVGAGGAAWAISWCISSGDISLRLPHEAQSVLSGDFERQYCSSVLHLFNSCKTQLSP